MFARYGTREGLSRWPGPWRERRKTVTPSHVVSMIASLGRPKGVSTSCRRVPSPCAPSASPSPDPPIKPTRNSLMRDEGKGRDGATQKQIAGGMDRETSRGEEKEKGRGVKKEGGNLLRGEPPTRLHHSSRAG